MDLVLYLFLSHLAFGIVFTLAIVSREAGVKFFRFNYGLAAILLAIALAVHRPAAADVVGAVELGAVVLAGAAIVLYWGTVGRALASIRPGIVAVAIGGGLVAMVAQAISAAAGRPVTIEALTIASVLSSAALLGGACTAMILGHWYLVIPSMQVGHLQSIAKAHIASTVVRIAVVAAVVFFALATSLRIQPEFGPTFHRYILSVSGVFFWQRVLFGLFGPAVLSVLTWETAKIQSTQSATGILYIDFFTVIVGEVLATYLLVATRVPV